MPDADVLSTDHTPGEDLELMLGAVARAGEIALGHFNAGVRHWLKDGDSPVSDADMAVDAYLKQALRGARPDYGWLSEESENDARRERCRKVFIVDPIDGTRGYIAGSDEWTICAAVAEDGEVTSGVILNPVRGEMFRAVRGGGAWRNDTRIGVNTVARLEGARLAAAKRAIAMLGPRGAQLESRYIASLAYRFALVASGEYDATVSAGTAREWDVAAAGLIVEEAGGRVTHGDGRRPVYNKPEPVIPPLFAAGDPLHSILRDAAAGTGGRD